MASSEPNLKNLWLETPLIHSKPISALLDANVYLKLDVSWSNLELVLYVSLNASCLLILLTDNEHKS